MCIHFQESQSDETNIKTNENIELKQAEVHFAKDEASSVELCDLEPASSAVFRKVTVRRRRQDMRKIAAVDKGMIIF